MAVFNKMKDMLKNFDTSFNASLISQDQILKMLDQFDFKNKAYDQAMDAAYKMNSEGGGNHRLFDGGHDLDGAWDAVSNKFSDDTFMQEVLGYVKGLWNDLSTTKGLPFDTMEKADYDAFSNWIAQNTPFGKDWAYDLTSFDAGEVFATTLGVVAVVFHLKNDDIEKLAEALGGLGIISIITANPLMGIFTVITFGYSFFIKKKELDKKAIFKSASTTGLSLWLFSTLGLTGAFFIFEIIIVLVATKLFKTKILDNENLKETCARLAADFKNSIFDHDAKTAG